MRYDAVSFDAGSEGPLISSIPPARTFVPSTRSRTSLPREGRYGKPTTERRSRNSSGRRPRPSKSPQTLGIFEGNGRIRKITLVSQSTVLGDFPERRVHRREGSSPGGGRIHRGVTAESIANGGVRLKNGANLVGDMVFVAIGIRPSPLFRNSGLPTGEDGDCWSTIIFSAWTTLNCLGAVIASPWRDPHWPGSVSMPCVRTAPFTETCRRFSRGGLFKDSIPGATIS